MKKINTMILIVVALSILIVPGAITNLKADESGKTLKKRVAVFAFEDKTNHQYRWWTGQPVGEGMADMLVTALAKSGKYRVFERKELDAIAEKLLEAAC